MELRTTAAEAVQIRRLSSHVPTPNQALLGAAEALKRRTDWVEPAAPGEWDLTTADKVGEDE